MNVLSLFNGMGTLRQAMNNLGIKINKYYSSEIKSYAIKLQQHHFPDVIQVGDIKNWRNWDIDWSSIDFIGSGSPCQNLSNMGRKEGLYGDKSSLFFVFIEILNHCKKLNSNVIFLQENVVGASDLDIGIMSREMGVYPVKLNSSLVTAQNRDRYYWSNIRTKKTMFDLVTDIPKPENKNIFLQDILTSGYSKKEKHGTLLHRIYYSFCYTNENSDEAQSYLKSREKYGYTLIFDKGFYRLVNKVEMCRLQGFPDHYCEIINKRQAGSLLGDGWTLPIIEHILSFMKK